MKQSRVVLVTGTSSGFGRASRPRSRPMATTCSARFARRRPARLPAIRCCRSTSRSTSRSKPALPRCSARPGALTRSSTTPAWASPARSRTRRSRKPGRSSTRTSSVCTASAGRRCHRCARSAAACSSISLAGRPGTAAVPRLLQRKQVRDRGLQRGAADGAAPVRRSRGDDRARRFATGFTAKRRMTAASTPSSPTTGRAGRRSRAWHATSRRTAICPRSCAPSRRSSRRGHLRCATRDNLRSASVRRPTPLPAVRAGRVFIRDTYGLR